jgi:hypothetical protein
MKNMKTSERKKRPYKGVTLMRAHKWKNDKKIKSKGTNDWKQRKLKGIKGTNKWKKLKQLASYYSIFF